MITNRVQVKCKGVCILHNSYTHNSEQILNMITLITYFLDFVIVGMLDGYDCGVCGGDKPNV